MRFRIFSAICLIMSCAALSAGGWAVISVSHLPDSIVAGQRTDVAFMIRQHGVHPAAGLPASAEATFGTERVAADVTPGKEKGLYVASFTVPHPGEWTLVIHSGHGDNPANATWLPLVAVAAGQQHPKYTPGRQGARLFVAKGCMTCHKHPSIDTRSTQVSTGPMLGTKPLDAGYVSRILRNPPKAGNGVPEYGEMPDLGLSDAEIAALTAFVADAAPRSTRR